MVKLGLVKLFMNDKAYVFGTTVDLDKGDIVEVDTQAKALLEVKSGNCDAAIIDSLMAGAMIGESTDYADLVATVALNSEKYGVGFRKGSDLAAKLNDFFKAAYADGSMIQVAETYGVQLALIEQK